MTTDAELDQVFQDGGEVARAYEFVRRTYSGTPCRYCKDRDTVGIVYQRAVMVSCAHCGSATRIGSLADLWDPHTTPRQSPPALRTARDRLNARTRLDGTL